MREIPLFPLNTVLFPGMMLPLHIFETRYKRMVHHCVMEREPFGVVLIREGNEVGPGAKVFDIGTLAYITQVDQLEDGRLNIASLGVDRFKISNLSHHEAYLTGKVELFPFENTSSSAAVHEAARLEPVLREYLAVVAKIGNVEILMDKIPAEPDKLAFLTAIALQTPTQDKQELLSIPSLPELMQQERVLLARETEILRLMT
ncbi:MAG: LON peptidase substrate-binding domain-containing protein, partial [Anaerolineae bacterium]|nr:LON peptidase substrate-binding domain-containing protein [Anaerolineae bacterium]